MRTSWCFSVYAYYHMIFIKRTLYFIMCNIYVLWRRFLAFFFVNCTRYYYFKKYRSILYYFCIKLFLKSNHHHAHAHINAQSLSSRLKYIMDLVRQILINKRRGGKILFLSVSILNKKVKLHNDMSWLHTYLQ